MYAILCFLRKRRRRIWEKRNEIPLEYLAPVGGNYIDWSCEVREMKILLFGISCVGKTTTVELLAEKLGCSFYDLDEEVKTRLNTTIGKFVSSNFRYERDKIRSGIINGILKRDEDMVFSITPMCYTRFFKKQLSSSEIILIELRDTPENIFSRIIFTDENDVPYKDDKYVQKHKDHYMHEIKEDLKYFREVYRKIGAAIFRMNGDTPERVVERIIDDYSLQSSTETEIIRGN